MRVAKSVHLENRGVRPSALRATGPPPSPAPVALVARRLGRDLGTGGMLIMLCLESMRAVQGSPGYRAIDIRLARARKFGQNENIVGTRLFCNDDRPMVDARCRFADVPAPTEAQ